MGNNTGIQLRNDTASNWTSDNPTLAQGEIGLETDTNRIKFGDGTTAWNALSYVGAGSSFKYGKYILSADQTSNLAAGDHVEWDTLASGSLNVPSTGSGQAKGIITLPANKTYKLRSYLLFGFSGATGTNTYILYDRTNGIQIGLQSLMKPPSSTSNNFSSYYIIEAEITVGGTPVDIDVRFNTSTACTSLYKDYTQLYIEEYGGY